MFRLDPLDEAVAITTAHAVVEHLFIVVAIHIFVFTGAQFDFNTHGSNINKYNLVVRPHVHHINRIFVLVGVLHFVLAGLGHYLLISAWLA